MNSEALQNLPPEMQERLAMLMQQGQQPQPAAPKPAPPLAKPPSLMDHLVALRQETAAMRQEVSSMRNEMVQLAQVVQANSNVVEGVGQAVGHIYQMFQQTSDPGPTYSQGFQQAQPGVEDADY